jgi:probable F420-dependent oxidoreductase
VEFGIVNIFPPPRSAVERLRLAEQHGFDRLWIPDSHVIWSECFTQLGWLGALARPGTLRFGTMVTNPATRDPIVIASALATLQQLSGGRILCGLGRGDSAVRVLKRRPATVAALERAVGVIRSLTRGESVEVDGDPVRLPWASAETAVPVFVAAYGPRMLALAGRVADGLILECADVHYVTWALERVRESAVEAGRDLADFEVILSTATFVSADRAAAREQVRPQGAVVGNHVAEVMRNVGPASLPAELERFVGGRSGYDYEQHARLDAAQADYVSDEMVDRLCIVGDAADCVRKILELAALGVTSVNFYAQTDDFDAQMATYAGDVIPHVAAELVAGARG